MSNEYIIAPEKIIIELMEVNSMTINELSLKLGIDIKMTKEILKGEASITTSILAELEKIFNIPVSF